MITKHIAYNEKFVHLKIGLSLYEYLEALGPDRLWAHPRVTS